MSTTEFDDLKADHARRYLQDIADKCRDIKAYEAELRMLRENLSGVKAIRYDKDNVSSTPNPDRMADAVLQAMDLEDYGEQNINLLQEDVEEAADKLRGVGGLPGAILRSHYLYNRPYKVLEREFGYSKSAVFAMAREGLVELYNIGLPLEYTIPAPPAL